MRTTLLATAFLLLAALTAPPMTAHGQGFTLNPDPAATGNDTHVHVSFDCLPVACNRENTAGTHWFPAEDWENTTHLIIESYLTYDAATPSPVSFCMTNPLDPPQCGTEPNTQAYTVWRLDAEPHYYLDESAVFSAEIVLHMEVVGQLP